MKKLLVIAGEVSGDLHGGQVALELKKLRPDLQMFGTGGSLLKSAGVELFYSVDDLAVIGFSEVLKVYRSVKRVFDEMVAKLDEEKPDAVFLVDYQMFNLRMAAEAKKRGIKVIYYVAPKVWAWNKKRVNIIRRFVDELIVLFPFEVSFFEKEGVKAHFFGNPSVEVVKPTESREETRRRYGLAEDETLVSLLPGSRKNELSRHFPLLFETVHHLNQRKEKMRYICPLASNVSAERLGAKYGSNLDQMILVEDDTYNVVAHSDFALVASGTAALETAILGTPNIIYYKSSLATYLIGKYIAKIKAIGLPNIIAEKIVVPENPRFTSPSAMANDVIDFLDNASKYEKLKTNLLTVKRMLGEPGAYRKTARYINEII